MLPVNFIFQSWLDQYQLIHHLILYSNVLMVIQGKEGAGKTSYIKGILRQLPSEFNCQAISPDKLNSSESLALNLRQLFSLSTLEVDTGSEPLELINQIVDRKKHCILIVDDAHLLDHTILSELLFCLNCQQDSVYFHCLLIGSPLLTKTFDTPHLQERKEADTHIFDMPELTVDEIKAFLKFKFSSLGLMQANKLSDNQVQALIDKSEGNLSDLTDKAKAQLTNKSEVSISTPGKLNLTFHTNSLPKNIKRITGIFGAFIILIGIVQIIVSPSNKASHKIQHLVLPSKKKEFQKDEVVRDFEGRPGIMDTINLTQRELKSRGSVKISKHVPISMIPRHELLQKKQLKKTAIEKDSVDTGPSIEKQIQAIRAAHKRQAKTETSVIDSVLVIPEPQLPKATSKPIKPVKPVKKLARRSHSHKVATKKPVPQKRLVKKPLNKKVRNTRKLSAKRVNGYGIQLVAARDINSTKRFARKYHVYNQANYYTTRVKGKKWYVLVLGQYKNQAMAKAAIAKLPSKLRAKKPWVRYLNQLIPVN